MCACANDHIAQIPSVVGKEEMVIHSNIDKILDCQKFTAKQK